MSVMQDVDLVRSRVNQLSDPEEANKLYARDERKWRILKLRTANGTNEIKPF